MAKLGYFLCIPFAFLLRWFYNLTGSYGWAIILFTLIVKLIMLPFQMKSKKSMIRMNRMQAQIKEIQTKYANNKQLQNEEIARLNQEQGVNPMSGCLWSFLPLPILIALYSILRKPITHFMMMGEEIIEVAKEALAAAGVTLNLTGTATAYEQMFVAQSVAENIPEFAAAHEGWINIQYSFLGLNMGAVPWDARSTLTTGGWTSIGLFLIPVLAAGLSYLQMKVSTMGQSKDAATAATNKSMNLMMPLMSLWIGFSMPAALGIYWVAQSVFSIIQEYFMGKFYTKKLEEEENERQARLAEERARRQAEGRRKQAEDVQRGKEEEKKTAKERFAEKREEKHSSKNTSVTTEAGRVDNRPYARGRAFSEEHYKD